MIIMIIIDNDNDNDYHSDNKGNIWNNVIFKLLDVQANKQI